MATSCIACQGPSLLPAAVSGQPVAARPSERSLRNASKRSPARYLAPLARRSGRNSIHSSSTTEAATKILSAAMKLSVQERVRVAEKLLESADAEATTKTASRRSTLHGPTRSSGARESSRILHPRVERRRGAKHRRVRSRGRRPLIRVHPDAAAEASAARRRYAERDPAVARRFSPSTIERSNASATIPSAGRSTRTCRAALAGAGSGGFRTR
jgi:hypothetical protein